MDLVKIGKYIAGKRRERNLTQRQLAELLGMSDKSVSKWERGVCLPDVSVYSELCEALGISINEFLAGEDLAQESIAQKSEENIISVATDGKNRQKRLKQMIRVLAVICIAAVLIAGGMLFYAIRPQNIIRPVGRDSVEMQTAELLSGSSGVFMYNYTATDDFSSLQIFITEYQNGKLISKENSELSYEDIGSPKQGTILIVPDFEHFVVKLIVATEGSKVSKEIPILEDAKDREYYVRAASGQDNDIAIQYGKEQGLVALAYGRNGVDALNISAYEEGRASAGNDYEYYFSVSFCK